MTTPRQDVRPRIAVRSTPEDVPPPVDRSPDLIRPRRGVPGGHARITNESLPLRNPSSSEPGRVPAAKSSYREVICSIRAAPVLHKRQPHTITTMPTPNALPVLRRPSQSLSPRLAPTSFFALPFPPIAPGPYLLYASMLDIRSQQLALHGPATSILHSGTPAVHRSTTFRRARRS